MTATDAASAAGCTAYLPSIIQTASYIIVRSSFHMSLSMHCAADMQKAMSADSWPLMRRGRYCEEILRSWTTASHSRVEMAKNKLSVCSFKCRRLHRAIGASSTGVVYTVCLSVYTNRQYTPRLYELYVPMRLYDFVLIYEHWLLVIPLELDVLNQINFQVLACLL